MRRLPVFGLRGRIVAALIFTSAVVLGVAAATLLPPLERNLRQEEQRSLRATAIASRPAFTDLDERDVTPTSARLDRLVDALERRTGARVLLFDETGTKVIDTQPRQPVEFDDVRAALASSKVIDDVKVHGSSPDVARLALPLTIDHEPYVLALRKPLDDSKVGTRVVKRALITATLVGLAVALLLGLGIATTMLRRLRRLRDATLMLADHGLDSELATDSSRDEVGDLGRAFSTMQARLREQEHARRAFVATASHELRTPLTSLRAMLELLEEDLHGEPPDLADARRQVSEARTQSSRLAGLAADLLDLSRLDADVRLRSEPVELTEVCRAVAAEFSSASGEPLTFEEPATPCWAMGDPSAVARIVRILVDNALRFSPEGEPPVLAIECQGNERLLSVTDRGPGVPSDERELVFERFKRGTATGGEAGFGLGLAIGRELAERMGGALVLAPTATGACFVLRLAAAPALGDLTEIQHDEVPS
jgi:signal transduction histidine kinase